MASILPPSPSPRSLSLSLSVSLSLSLSLSVDDGDGRCFPARRSPCKLYLRNLLFGRVCITLAANVNNVDDNISNRAAVTCTRRPATGNTVLNALRDKDDVAA